MADTRSRRHARPHTRPLRRPPPPTRTDRNPAHRHSQDHPTDPALLDQLPLAGDILQGLPPALKARLLAAFDLEVLWNKPGQQATVFAEITENTLQAIPGIMDPSQDGHHDTSTGTDTAQPAAMWDLSNTLEGTRGHTDHPVGARGQVLMQV